jgi:hypothetical protein
MPKRLCSAFATGLRLAGGNSFARDCISMVSSSTAYPIAAVVAENFGSSRAFKAPIIALHVIFGTTAHDVRHLDKDDIL